MSDGYSWWLYVLELENDKWYVGITSKTPEERMQEHLFKKRAAYWTLKHRPVAIELKEDLGQVSRAHAEAYENQVTRQLMKERGLNNVRGGDLRDEEQYIMRFGRIYLREGWETLTALVFFMLLSLYFMLDKYLPNIIESF